MIPSMMTKMGVKGLRSSSMSCHVVLPHHTFVLYLPVSFLVLSENLEKVVPVHAPSSSSSSSCACFSSSCSCSLPPSLTHLSFTSFSLSLSSQIPSSFLTLFSSLTKIESEAQKPRGLKRVDHLLGRQSNESNEAKKKKGEK